MHSAHVLDSQAGESLRAPQPRPDLQAPGVAEAAAMIRRGELKAEAYARQLLSRCDDARHINAFISLNSTALLEAANAADLAQASGRATGLLHGVPLAFKDNILAAGLPTTGGTAALAGTHSAGNAVVADRLFAHGALLLGKNGMHELAMGWTSDNPHYGRVANPHLPTHLAGGSSGGSAAAVAALMAPAAIGTDTNGSIRIPAALCGVAGFRPSVGRYPTGGVLPLSHTLDTVGPLARQAADLALLDCVMAGQPQATVRASLAGVRIAVSPQYYLSRLEPEVEKVFGEVRRRLGEAGVCFVEADVPGLDLLAAGIAPVLIRHESASALPAWLAAHADGVSMERLITEAGIDLVEALREGQRSLASPQGREDYYAALQRRSLLSAALQAYFRMHRADALMYPVVRVAATVSTPRAVRVSPAPDVLLADGSFMSGREAYGQNVSPASIAALPSLVLAGGLTPAGLPVGIAFDAPHGADSALLALGPALEQAIGLDLSFHS